MGKLADMGIPRSMRWAVGAAVVIALPFFAAAIVMGWQAIVLPEPAGRLTLARLLGAALFAFGFAVAFVSSVVALVAKSADKRVLAAAGVLLGCCHIALGFVVRRTIEDAAVSYNTSIAPVIVPILLWAASVWLALSSARKSPRKTESADEAANPHYSR